jgi:hypothetical protein
MNRNLAFLLSPKTSLAAVLLANAVLVGSSRAQTTSTLGETGQLGNADNGNANFLLADGPYHLSQPGVVNSLSFWVDNAAGQLKLGIFDAGPNNDCKGGKLKAQTNPFNTKASSWNTAKPASPATLAPGNYCLAYLPSDNNLSFRKGTSTGINNVYYPLQFGSMPATFAANPSGGDGFHWSLYAALTPTITLGEPRTLGYSDNGNANFLLANGPYYLSQPAVVNSLSFWVDNAAGQLELGIFDSGPHNDCKGGKLKAQTNPFNTKASSWNTAGPASPATLAPGNYCLAYLPSDNNLSFRKGISTGLNNVEFPLQFGPMPATFAANPSGGDGFHWSLYATLIPGTAVPVISFNPPNPSIPANAPRGTVVATIQVKMSDGSAFTGVLGFGTPYEDDNATFTISGSNLIVNPSGPGVSADASTTQNVTVVAQQ